MKSVALCFFFFSSRRRHTRSDRDWSSDVCSSDLANVGYPIVEAAPDGTFEITKHPGTDGRISVAGGTEQLGYEMGSPGEDITPHRIADFTTLRPQQPGKKKGRRSGRRGGHGPHQRK